VSSYQALVRFANTGDDQRTAVADGLRDALSATPTSRPWRSISQQLVLGIADELRAHVDVRSLRFVRPARCPSLRQAATSDGTSTTRSTRPRSTKRGARCSTRRPPPLHRVSVGGYTRRRRHYRAGPWCTVHCSWARGGVGRGRRRAHRPPGATEVPEGEWQPFGLLWRRSNQVCYL